MSVNRTNKIKLALTGPSSAPKLLKALQLGYGLCRNWNQVVVLGNCPSDPQYQHLGDYCTLRIEKDAPPSRYTELLNLVAGCGKEVVIFSGLSNEWLFGTSPHISSSYYEDVLRAHRTFFLMLRHAPIHVIGLIDTRTAYLQKDEQGKRKLRSAQLVQQEDIVCYFDSVLHLDKRGNATASKDETKVFPCGTPFMATSAHGVQLAEWCRSVEPSYVQEMRMQIDRCTTLQELYQLLFECDDLDCLNLFTQKKLELEAKGCRDKETPMMDMVKGGLSS